MDIEFEVVPVKGRITLSKELADLRVAYFAEYPYLQTTAPSRALNEMRSLLMQKDAIVVVARHLGKIIGCNISVPVLTDGYDHHMQWFEVTDTDCSKWLHSLYVMTRPEYRLSKVSSGMADVLDAEAKRLGYEGRIIMMIDRNNDKAPEGYRPPIGYFLKRGYEKLDIPPIDVAWTDIGDSEETPKRYEFLIKRIA